MSKEELERTESFLDELMTNSSSFSKFMASISSNFKASHSGPFTIKFIENAINQVYSKSNVLPPEIDLIHYYFDDIVYKNLVAISDSELSNRMKQIITDQRNEIDKRYIYLCLGAAIPYQLLHKI